MATLKEIEEDVEEAFQDGFSKVFKPTPEEAQLVKRLYKGFLIGQWTGLHLSRKKGFYKDDKIGIPGSSGGRIEWWIHIAKGLIETQDNLGKPLPQPQKPDKLDILSITRAIATS